jgi:hypothetical protein
MGGNWSIIQSMLEAGADPKSVSGEGTSLVMYVCMGGLKQFDSEAQRLEILKDLIARGADVSVRSWNVSRPCHCVFCSLKQKHKKKRNDEM